MKFRIRSLRKLYEEDDARGLNPSLVRRIRDILTALSVASMVQGRGHSVLLPSFPGRFSSGILERTGQSELTDPFLPCRGRSGKYRIDWLSLTGREAS